MRCKYITVRRIPQISRATFSFPARIPKLLILTVGLLSTPFLRKANAQDRDHVKVSELELRKMEHTHITPFISPNSSSYGLTVVQVFVGKEGLIEKTVILQASSSEAVLAISQALSRWRFNQEMLDGKPVGLMGRISFYSIRMNGKNVLEDPFSEHFVCVPDYKHCTN